MSKINKCYMYTKEYSCSIEQDLIHHCFIFQFGDGELIDKDGDSYFIYYELDFITKEEVIQLWYENEIVTIYSTKPESIVFKSYLTQEEISEIRREFHRILDKFKEDK